MQQIDPALMGGGVAKRPLRRSLPAAIGSFARRKPLGALGAGIIILLGLSAIFADLMPYGALDVHLRERLQSPSWSHPAGTDALGRDLLTRLFHGARVTLKIGFLGVLIGVSAGTVVGLVSGFFAGKIDIVLQRLVDALMAFPILILALSLASIREPSDTNTLVIIGIVLIPTTARIVRGATLKIKTNQYIDASRALGATDWRIIWRHILPNIAAPIIVVASVFLGAAIIVEATLSFLGVSGSIERPSWGAMIADPEIRRNVESNWWLVLFPGMALVMAIYSINMFGDALRDVLDPRLRGTGGGRYGS